MKIKKENSSHLAGRARRRGEREEKVEGCEERLGAILSSNDLWEAEGSLSLGGDLVYMLQGSSL